jgi:hypothetical protein
VVQDPAGVEADLGVADQEGVAVQDMVANQKSQIQ